MAKTAAKSTTAQNTRIYYTKSDDIGLPNLVDHQNKSFQWFVDEGLGELLAEVSPIDDYTGTKLSLSFKTITSKIQKSAKPKPVKTM